MARLAARHADTANTDLSDGPSMVTVLFVLSLIIGVLVGVGVSELTPPNTTGRLPHEGQALSREAAQLGYASESAFLADNQRASTALLQVLQAQPGTQRLWENAETGNRGVIWGAGETQKPDGTTCREMERRTLINNAYRNANATACHKKGQPWGDTAQWRNE